MQREKSADSLSSLYLISLFLPPTTLRCDLPGTSHRRADPDSHTHVPVQLGPERLRVAMDQQPYHGRAHRPPALRGVLSLGPASGNPGRRLQDVEQCHLV